MDNISFRKIWEHIKTEKLVNIILFTLIIGAFALWKCFESTKDFGLNFFTEMLGAAITVFVIDRLIQKREEERSIPQKMAAYEDVRLFVSRYVVFWVDAYNQSVPDEFPKSIESFFSNQGMSKIWNHLNLNAEPNVIPPRKWWDWIVQSAKEFDESGDKIMERHSFNLDPIAYGYVHQITESSFIQNILMLPSVRHSDVILETNRPPVLGCFSIRPSQEHYDAILGLINWCNLTRRKLLKYNPSLKQISEYINSNPRQLPPKAMYQPSVEFISSEPNG